MENKSNNLSYWGLDYPPLSGYQVSCHAATASLASKQTLVACMQSWVFGQAIHLLEPDAVALHTSHGYETPHSKFLMRLTVIASDIIGGFACLTNK